MHEVTSEPHLESFCGLPSKDGKTDRCGLDLIRVKVELLSAESGLVFVYMVVKLAWRSSSVKLIMSLYVLLAVSLELSNKAAGFTFGQLFLLMSLLFEVSSASC